jgi:hypothetical protein
MTYYENNKTARLNYQKQYYQENKEEIKKYTKHYYTLNKDKLKQKRKGKLPVRKKQDECKFVRIDKEVILSFN